VVGQVAAIVRPSKRWHLTAFQRHLTALRCRLGASQTQPLSADTALCKAATVCWTQSQRVLCTTNDPLTSSTVQPKVTRRSVGLPRQNASCGGCCSRQLRHAGACTCAVCTLRDDNSSYRCAFCPTHRVYLRNKWWVSAKSYRTSPGCSGPHHMLPAEPAADARSLIDGVRTAQLP
jgi:hypothetical protein